MMDKAMQQMLCKDVAYALGVPEDKVFTGVNVKNNGKKRQYIAARKDEGGDTEISVCFYLDLIEDALNCGRMTHKKAIEIIAESLSNDKLPPLEVADATAYCSKEYALKNCFVQLVNKDMNLGMLMDCPHFDLLDLSGVVRIVVKEYDDCQATFLVTNRFLEQVGIGEQELFDAAIQNTQRTSGFCIKTMSEVMAEMIGMDVDTFNIVHGHNTPDMYVATNATRTNGAAIMIDGDVFDGLARKLDTDLYILPSSIHEVLIYPADNVVEVDDLRSMVKNVNRDEVAPEEVLSDEVYLYRRNEKRFCIAE